MSPHLLFAHLTIAALLLTPPLAAQRTGSGGSTGGGRSTRQPRTDIQQERRPVFVSGRVAVEEGGAPPERVSIERVCNGRARREAYADSHGNFGFQLGAEVDVMQDASVGALDNMRSPGAVGGVGLAGTPGATPPTQSAGISERELMGCELRASLAGYISDTINLAGRQVFDNPYVGTIVLHRLSKAGGTKVSVTTLQAPGEARKAWEQAQSAMAKNQRSNAIAELEKAVALYPKFAEALSLLGELYSREGRKPDAARVLQQAIEADPKFVSPYIALALLAGQERDWNRMAELSQQALALNPFEYPAPYYYNAIANYNLHNPDAAEKNALQARRIDSQYHIPRIDLLLANILLQREDYAGAAEHLRSFLKYQPEGAEADTARQLLGDTEQKLAAAEGARPPK